MTLTFPISLTALDHLPAAPTITSLAAVIASVKLIAAAELRMLALYQEIERDGREASVRAVAVG